MRKRLVEQPPPGLSKHRGRYWQGTRAEDIIRQRQHAERIRRLEMSLRRLKRPEKIKAVKKELKRLRRKYGHP